jgi:proton-coupled amino acid transporter
LPHGFATAGYLVALPVMAITTIFFLYSSRCLLECWQYEHDNNACGEETLLLAGSKFRHRQRTELSYPELAYRGLGVHGETLVKTGIALMQSGVCLTYFIFVSQNLRSFAMDVFGLNVQARTWLLVMIFIQVPLSWIKDIRKLTLTNLVANALILYGLITCLGFAVKESVQGADEPMTNIATHVQALIPFQNTWYLFIGTSVSLRARYVSDSDHFHPDNVILVAQCRQGSVVRRLHHAPHSFARGPTWRRTTQTISFYL